MRKAFKLGTPPHGGIALGLDRLIMLLAGETSLKETIAFPMTSTGRTAVMDGPNEVSEDQLKELGLELSFVVDEKKAGKEWFGYKVINIDQFVKSNTSVLILASFDKEEIDDFCKEQENVEVVVLRD